MVCEYLVNFSRFKFDLWSILKVKVKAMHLYCKYPVKITDWTHFQDIKYNFAVFYFDFLADSVSSFQNHSDARRLNALRRSIPLIPGLSSPGLILLQTEGESDKKKPDLQQDTQIGLFICTEANYGL